MKIYKNHILYFILLVSICSCSGEKMDDFKEYTTGGEFTYTEKIDSLKIYGGRERVLVQGVVDADPKIEEFRVFWNNGKDSVSVPVQRSSGVDTLEVVIDNLDENIYNFVVRTYDGEGNSSIPVSETGQTYGSRYQDFLSDRRVISNNLVEGDLAIEYAGMDLSSGVIGTEIELDNNTDDPIFVPIDSSRIVIENYEEGSSYRYRTVFLPEETAIDTFYTDFVSFTPIVVPLLKNSEISFVSKDPSSGNRFRLLKDWTSNQAIQDYNGGQGMGWDKNYNDGLFAIQIGHGGTPNSIINGKIYQTVPSGAADFRMNFRMRAAGNHTDILEADAADNRYAFIVIAKGNDELPDVEAIVDGSASSIIAYQRITREGGDSYSIDFTVEEAGDLTIGLVFNSSGASRYLRIEKFEIIEDK